MFGHRVQEHNLHLKYLPCKVQVDFSIFKVKMLSPKPANLFRLSFLTT